MNSLIAIGASGMLLGIAKAEFELETCPVEV